MRTAPSAVLRSCVTVLQVERNINAVHRDHMAAVETSLAETREEVADRDAKLAQVLPRVLMD